MFINKSIEELEFFLEKYRSDLDESLKEKDDNKINRSLSHIERIREELSFRRNVKVSAWH